MSGKIIRELRPEEEEILRKREELATVRAMLAELELELADLRSELAAFEGRYLRQVGILYADLDEWRARILALRAEIDPSTAANKMAEAAREQARQTHDAAHAAASQTHNFNPSPELKRLFREVAKHIHPDFATDAADRERRSRLMAEANRAYQAGDAQALKRILDEYRDCKPARAKEGIDAELVRITRQINQARERVAQIERELTALRRSEIAKLRQEAEAAQELGSDLLTELAAAVREQIQRAKKEHEALAHEARRA